MDFYDFPDALRQLNTLSAMYLSAKKAREFCTGHYGHLPNDICMTIECVLGEKICQYEKQILELATKIAGRPEEKPEKKKK